MGFAADVEKAVVKVGLNLVVEIARRVFDESRPQIGGVNPKEEVKSA